MILKFKHSDKIKGMMYAVFFMAPFVLKAQYVDKFVHCNTQADIRGALQVFTHDSIVYFVMLLFVYISFLPNLYRIVAWGLRLFAIMILSVYVVDLFIIINFNTHLTIEDAVKHSGYAVDYLRQIHNGQLVLGLGLLFFVVSAVFITEKHKFCERRQHVVVLLAMVLFLTVYGCSNRAQYVNSWVYKNVFEYNWELSSLAAPYSEEFITNFEFQEKIAVTGNIPKSPNIIILMVESLSSYQSKLFSGIKDWTPNLDKIAKDNMYFSNFYANGYLTEDGEVSILTGLLPLTAPSIYANDGGVSFRGFYNISETLPNVLKERGYTSEFITSADLGFSNTRSWARNIGFDYTEGHEHPYYNTWPRYHFQAAPDEALYDRVLSRIEQNSLNDRYFLFVKTVSTHHPFFDPEAMTVSEAGTFKYADKQLGLFYEELKQTDFFDNGLLVIVGDHHSMVPLKKSEMEMFGASRASARVPLVVVGGGARIAVDLPFQQVDIFNSLRNYVSDVRSVSSWRGDFLTYPVIPPQYIAHKRGDSRNNVNVFFEELDLNVILDGDDTRLRDAYYGDGISFKDVVDKINWERISRQNDVNQINAGFIVQSGAG